MISSNARNRDIMFEITEHIGVVASYPTGWKKELNIVSWNGSAPKYDIRDWDPGHEHMSRGITLHENELRAIMELVEKNAQRKLNESDKDDDIFVTEAADKGN